MNYERLEGPFRRRVFEYVARLVKFRIASDALSVNDTDFIRVARPASKTGRSTGSRAIYGAASAGDVLSRDNANESLYEGDLIMKKPVNVATTEDLGPAFPAFSGEIDGVPLKIGNRVLVKDQLNSTENGYYEVRRRSPANTRTDW